MALAVVALAALATVVALAPLRGEQGDALGALVMVPAAVVALAPPWEGHSYSPAGAVVARAAGLAQEYWQAASSQESASSGLGGFPLHSQGCAFWTGQATRRFCQ
jgi:hypothetical protein